MTGKLLNFAVDRAVRRTRRVIERRENHLMGEIACVGFRYRHTASIDMFHDGADAKARDAVRDIFAGE